MLVFVGVVLFFVFVFVFVFVFFFFFNLSFLTFVGFFTIELFEYYKKERYRNTFKLGPMLILWILFHFSYHIYSISVPPNGSECMFDNDLSQIQNILIKNGLPYFNLKVIFFRINRKITCNHTKKSQKTFHFKRLK